MNVESTGKMVKNAPHRKLFSIFFINNRQNDLHSTTRKVSNALEKC